MLLHKYNEMYQWCESHEPQVRQMVTTQHIVYTAVMMVIITGRIDNQNTDEQIFT